MPTLIDSSDGILAPSALMAVLFPEAAGAF
jgi:hypothetical protein